MAPITLRFKRLKRGVQAENDLFSTLGGSALFRGGKVGFDDPFEPLQDQPMQRL